MGIKYRVASMIYRRVCALLDYVEEHYKTRFVPSVSYEVSGAETGYLCLFPDKTYFYKDTSYNKTDKYIWQVIDDSINLLDQWFCTNDHGATWYSHHIKLNRVSGSWQCNFQNSPGNSFHSVNASYNAKRLASRENELLEYMPKNGIVAELGVEKGLYARYIADRNTPNELHLIDVWDECPAPWPSREEQKSNYDKLVSDFKTEIKNKQVVVHKGDDLSYLDSFPDRYFDWVYIDTTHQYEQTLRELNLAAKKVKENGYICGHDFYDSSHARRYGFGVIKAVNEFVRSGGWRLDCLTKDMPSSYVLKYQPEK